MAGRSPPGGLDGVLEEPLALLQGSSLVVEDRGCLTAHPCSVVGRTDGSIQRVEDLATKTNIYL